MIRFYYGFERNITRLCQTADYYWGMQTDVAAPIVSALGKASDEIREKVKKETYEIINQKYPYGNVLIDSSALVIYGDK